MLFSSFGQMIWVLVQVVATYTAYFVWHTYNSYEKYMGGKRLNRNNSSCPSNRQPPDIKDAETNRQKVRDNSRYSENFDDCELLHHLDDVKVVKRENTRFRELMKRSATLKPAAFRSKGSLSNQKAVELDMDHIYISFRDFLWAYASIGHFSYLLWLKLTRWLLIKQYLVKKGWMKMKPVDYAELAGKLCLEQSQAIHYYARTQPGSALGDIAGFFFTDFPYFDSDCKYQTAKLFAVDIDLKTKKMVKAKLDSDNLTAKQAVILLWYNTIGAQHVKLHALANWGVNFDERIKEKEPFFYRNSLVTTMYNFFGKSLFHGYMKGWESDGLLHKGWDLNGWVQSVNEGIKANIWQHAQIVELVPHSRFVNFVVKVRAIFINEFAKHKSSFPGVHGEAMFVGTILHSLDHTIMDWNMEDPLWLDVDDPRFGALAKLGRIVKMGFVQDVPGLYFHKRFKGSGHPFYESVYAKAAKIDKELADHMDTCIVK